MIRPKIMTFDFFGTVIDWRRGFELASALPHADFVRLVDAQGRMQKERFRKYADIVEDSLVEVQGLPRERAKKVGAEAGYFPLYPDSRDALHRLMRIAPCAALTNSDLL